MPSGGVAIDKAPGGGVHARRPACARDVRKSMPIRSSASCIGAAFITFYVIFYALIAMALAQSRPLPPVRPGCNPIALRAFSGDDLDRAAAAHRRLDGAQIIGMGFELVDLPVAPRPSGNAETAMRSRLNSSSPCCCPCPFASAS
ncbi:MAG: hypothetical protein H6872_12445 [Methylobacteriaceae bacterium]|nr:hypothetical protein [Methylobacteriaceae bacterium]